MVFHHALWLPWQSRQISASMDHPLPFTEACTAALRRVAFSIAGGCSSGGRCWNLCWCRGGSAGDGDQSGRFLQIFSRQKTGKKCLKQRPKLLENWSGKRIFVCMSQKNIWCHPLVINCFRCLQYERGMGLYYGIFPLCINNSNHYSNYSVLSCIIHTLYIN